MSLYLIELKIKTALELVDNIYALRLAQGAAQVSYALDAIGRDAQALRGVLREIINRPKEEER